MTTADGEQLKARALVAATGPFQIPRLPPVCARFPIDVLQVHSSRYRNPGALPPGGVLVVGSGGSGAQIAEDLLDAGRPVYLSVNRYRRMPRRYRGLDLTWWLLKLKVMERTKEEAWLDGQIPPTLLITGVRGGHDIHIRQLQAAGAVLLGRLTDCVDGVATFADDAPAHLTAADSAYQDFLRQCDAFVDREGLELPQVDSDPVAPLEVAPVPAMPALDLTAVGITSVVWCTGYQLDFSWVQAPLAGPNGAPVQRRGVTELPGLYVLGLHWMHTFQSGVFWGVGDDAAYLADHIARGRSYARA